MLKDALDFKSATGEVKYNMTNDFMFHYVLQKNEYALRGLVASLLHIKPEEITTIRVMNPIIQGETARLKDSTMDILVMLNQGKLVNLEMQVENEGNWDARSLHYLCKGFLNIDHGHDFGETKPVYHIGFLGYTLFKEHPKFYAMYRLKDVEDGFTYSDRFTLGVVELNHIDMATELDKSYGIDSWARLFKAHAWEEIRMLAQKNEYIDSAAQTMYQGNIEDWVLAICRKSNEELRGEEARRKRNAEMEEEIKRKENQLQEMGSQIQERENQLQEMGSQIQERENQLQQMGNQLQEKDNQLQEKDRDLLDIKTENARLKALLAKNGIADTP